MICQDGRARRGQRPVATLTGMRPRQMRQAARRSVFLLCFCCGPMALHHSKLTRDRNPIAIDPGAHECYYCSFSIAAAPNIGVSPAPLESEVPVWPRTPLPRNRLSNKPSCRSTPSTRRTGTGVRRRSLPTRSTTKWQHSAGSKASMPSSRPGRRGRPPSPTRGRPSRTRSRATTRSCSS